jgi:hypothetical protein
VGGLPRAWSSPRRGASRSSPHHEGEGKEAVLVPGTAFWTLPLPSPIFTRSLCPCCPPQRSCDHPPLISVLGALCASSSTPRAVHSVSRRASSVTLTCNVMAGCAPRRHRVRLLCPNFPTMSRSDDPVDHHNTLHVTMADSAELCGDRSSDGSCHAAVLVAETGNCGQLRRHAAERARELHAYSTRQSR